MCRSTTDELMTHDNPCHPPLSEKKNLFLKTRPAPKVALGGGRFGVSTKSISYWVLAWRNVRANRAIVWEILFANAKQQRKSYLRPTACCVFIYYTYDFRSKQTKCTFPLVLFVFFFIFGANLMHKCEIFHKLLNNRDRDGEREIFGMFSLICWCASSVCVCRRHSIKYEYWWFLFVFRFLRAAAATPPSIHRHTWSMKRCICTFTFHSINK